MTQYNRRTVVRGAAWTLPVVAVGAQAPAYAASTDAPSVGPTTGCKTPGDPNGLNCQGYKIQVAFNFAGPYTWTIFLNSVSSDGVDVTASIQPVTRTFTVSPANPMIEFRICTTDSAAKFNLGYTYTATRVGAAPTTISVSPYEVKLAPCK